jgi:Ca2+-binding RTX toxin-like protein
MQKLILGGLLATAAIAAVPSAASAAPASCTFDSAARTMEVRYGAGQTAMTIKNGASILFQDGATLRPCFDATTGKAATAFNTNKLTIKAVSGTGAQTQMTTIDETAAGFPEQNPNLHLFVFTGTNDRLVIKDGAGKDNIRLQDSLGPLIDLNMDGKDDLTMTTSNTTVDVDGGAGDDALDASGVHFYSTNLIGGDGNDFLFGGAKVDGLFGTNGNDEIFARDGLSETVAGGAGTDTVHVDGSDIRSGVETTFFN